MNHKKFAKYWNIMISFDNCNKNPLRKKGEKKKRDDLMPEKYNEMELAVNLVRLDADCS